jgi:hypothetical protein
MASLNEPKPNETMTLRVVNANMMVSTSGIRESIPYDSRAIRLLVFPAYE